MSAQITTRTIDAQVREYQDAPLGYLYCGGCVDPKRGGEIKAMQPNRLHHGHLSDPPTDRCDRCGRYSNDWPLTTIKVCVVTEHTPCRIF